jgi:hypothetical protein
MQKEWHTATEPFFNFSGQSVCVSSVMHVFREMDGWIPIDPYAHNLSICGQIRTEM